MSETDAADGAPVPDDGAAASPAGRTDAATKALRDAVDAVRRDPIGALADVLALTLAAWVLWWFSDDDGGFVTRSLRDFAVLALFATPVLFVEWRRTPRLVQWCLVALPAGALASLAFGVERSRFVADALTFGTVPVLVLAGARLSRRRWSAVALLGIVIAGFLAWSWLAGLKWWGFTDLGLQPRWEFVSWRNQSGILTSAFAVWIGGVVLAGRRSPSLVAGGLVALGLAGTWLSSSRAGIIFGVAGLLLVATLHVRSSPDTGRTALSSAGRLAGVAAATVVVVVALQTMLPATASTPLESRGGETVTGNAITRTKHWEAATNMFLDRPLTGQGLGSYRGINERFNPADGRLTSAAHSAWLEALGEGGLVFGLPLILLGGAAAVGTLRLVGRRRLAVEDDEFGSHRAALLGAIGGAATITAHASIDFDFRYETLLAVACLGGGALLAALDLSREDPTPDRGRARPLTVVLAALPAAGLLSVGIAGATRELQPSPSGSDAVEVLVDAYAPWETTQRAFLARQMAQRGQTDAALETIQPAVDWNPGDPAAQMARARVLYAAGELTAEELLDLLELPPTKLSQWVQTAEALLLGGDLREAEIAARQTISFHPEYEAWGIEATVARAWAVVLELGIRARGCEEAGAILADADAHGFDRRGTWMDELTELADELCEVA